MNNLKRSKEVVNEISLIVNVREIEVFSTCLYL